MRTVEEFTVLKLVGCNLSGLGSKSRTLVANLLYLSWLKKILFGEEFCRGPRLGQPRPRWRGHVPGPRGQRTGGSRVGMCPPDTHRPQ